MAITCNLNPGLAFDSSVLTAAIIGAVGSMAAVCGLALGWLLRNEHRLTRIEVRIENLENNNSQDNPQ